MVHRIVRAIPAALLMLVVPCFTPVGGGEPAKDWRRELAEPSREFTQMPFWFWNDELDNREIARQMGEFRSHGVYGFVIHARMGLPLEIPYMGERWLAHVRFAVEEAARTGMRVCLYDEGMYPSGSAHGEVVRSNPAFAAQGLSVSARDVTGPAEVPPESTGRGKHVATVVVRRAGKGGKLDLDGARVVDSAGGSVRLAEGAWRVMRFTMVPTGGHIRGVHPGEEGGQRGAPPAADLLNPDAMRAFLRFAYEPYHRTLREHFGTTAMAMFTDEPSLSGRGGRRGLQPWTDGLQRYFEKRRGYSLVPLLPALFEDAGPRTAKIREDFKLTLAERLDETYYQQLSHWCREHKVALTGHPAGSDEIRPLRLFQIPGQDMVWRWVLPGSKSALEGADSTVAKCSSSVARHDDRRRNANEVYGAYGWHLTMEEMKWLADWLIVRGVNLLYPHAFYYSIREERVHERPPDLGMHNAWWPHYRRFADYTSRLCGLMSGGRQVCDVAVLSVGNRLPWRAARWLLENQVDFNYLEDWRLVEQAEIRGNQLLAGPMRYRLLIVDEDHELTGAVAERVKAFQQAGGRVQSCGRSPSADLLAGLDRDLAIDPPCSDLRYAHVVKHGIDFYLVVNEGERPIRGTLACRARGTAEWFDPWRAEFRPAQVVGTDPTLAVALRLGRRESLVLAVDSARPAAVSPSRPPAEAPPDVIQVAGPWQVFDSQGKEAAASLGDWRKLPGLTTFAGTLRYRATLEASKKPGQRHHLDLGTVGDWAVVQLNGKDLGPVFWAPFAWDVTDALQNGKNELVVDVTNSLANRYDPQNARPAGLFGPVELRLGRTP